MVITSIASIDSLFPWLLSCFLLHMSQNVFSYILGHNNYSCPLMSVGDQFQGTPLPLHQNPQLLKSANQKWTLSSMATHSGLLAWRTSQTEEPGGLSPWGHKESGVTERLSPAHLPPKGLSHQPLQPLSLNTPQKSSGMRSGTRHPAFWKTGRTGLQIIKYFQETL